jgi:two-component system cell cycle sensor histidine kinase/response regulator CckA
MAIGALVAWRVVQNQAKRTMEETAQHAAFDAALLETTIESAPIGFAFVDPQLRFARINAFAARLMNRTPESLIGCNVIEVASATNVRLVERALKRVLSESEPVVNQRMGTRIGGPSGPRRELLVNFYPVRCKAGEMLGIAAVLLDITDRVALEEQLRQSQKLEAVGRLAGGVAHDFNNLLTVARTYCDLLLEEMPLGDVRRSDLSEIRNATDRAAVLARRLLAFGRKQVFAPRAIDLNETAHSLYVMFTRTLPESVKLQVQLAGDLRPLTADAGQVEQVLMNLVLNAVDAMPDGGTITISTTNADLPSGEKRGEQDSFVRLSVQDTGVGMDKETKDHIFEPFFTTKEPGKGTGLGLSTVYGIVEQHGGSIRIESEVGRGTTFHVFLPSDARPASTTPASSPATAPRQPRRATVLVVDDELSLVTSLHRMLSGRGYDVLRAGSGEEAIRVITRNPVPVQVVLTDLKMPGLSGRELFDAIAEASPATRILVMSGYAPDELRELIEERQMPFLSKPFALDDLVAAIEQVLARGTADPTSGAAPGRP